ncbi:hemagglutinin repeat-containing protein [Variovorax ginsengisoli]|uniref:Filamentous hemagglutinin n=1 Tax=Variovorax ginsengisoli TaxID=363844 RepID=A0ABT9S0K0_9BURK|nr:hemagglutinin repeat-containing protein [Variovorax ginsengisoli]MDP9897878.1 hypothetical protein [Variovorax ginsengisoli]
MYRAATLTSDIVWMQTQTVTLPDGSTQDVLVPKVYVAQTGPNAVKPGGALITGDDIRIEAGNIVNRGGTLGGANTQRAVLVASADIVNQGGVIQADAVGLKAGGDILNQTLTKTQTYGQNDAQVMAAGRITSLSNVGRIQAGNALVIDAGRDVVDTAGRIGSGGTASIGAGRDLKFDSLATGSSYQAQIGASSMLREDTQANVGQVTVGKDLQIVAGRDLKLEGTQASSGGTALLRAGGDLSLEAATSGQASDQRSDPVGTQYRQTRSQTTVQGASVKAGGDLTANAGTQEAGNLTVTGSQLDAKGATALGASRDIVIDTTRQTQASDDFTHSNRNGFLSKKSTTDSETRGSDVAAGSSVGGKTVMLSSGRDLQVTGSEIIADQGTTLMAKNNIAIEAATNTFTQSQFHEEKKSGLMGSGGIGVTIGSRAQSEDQKSASTTASASTIGAIAGNVTMVAGNTYRQVGSDVLAPGGDVGILAKNVDIVEARETYRSDTEQKQRSGGLTIAPTAPVLTAAQGVASTARAVGQTGNARAQALGAASVAMGAKSVVDTVAQSPSQAAGINLSISIGSSRNQSNSTEHSDAARGSTVVGGGNVVIAATGAGTDSNLTVQGGDIRAGQGVTLLADNQISLLAAQNDWDQHSTNKGSAASLGVSFGTSGFLVNASASQSKGRSDGTETLYTNTHVTAGDKATLVSGGDTTLRGAVVAANAVKADVGGDLRIESLQDRAKSDSKQQSAGGAVSVGAGVWSASVSASSAKASGEYASVTERSGIKAGDGGFDVNVQGDTDLKGGVISSTQAAIDGKMNSFQTASIATSDIVNRDTYKASGATLGVGLSGGSDKNGYALPTRTGGSAGAGKASGHETSVTRSGISGIAGDEAVRTDTDSTHALAKTWNTDTLVKDVQAQAQITQGFGANASKAVGDYAGDKAAELRREGKEEEAKAWDEGGTNRSLAHALLGGLTGGMQGAAGAGFAALAAPAISDLTKDLPDSVKGAVGAGLAAGLGASVGGSGGAAAGLNEDLNNRQLHQREYDYAKKNAKLVAKKLGISESDAEGRIVAEMLRNSDKDTAEGTGGVHDYEVRGVIGCQNLNCNASKTDPNYANADFNSQYISGNQEGYDRGLGQLPTGKTYNQLVASNIQNDPVGATVAGAGMVGLGYLMGGAGAATGVKVFGAGVGALANYAFQSGGQPTDWLDVGIAGGTGFLTSGLGLGSSVMINTGGSVLGSGIKGENPNAGMGAAAVGTVVGYGLGAGVQGGVQRAVDPQNWYRPQWIDMGMGMSRPNTPSAIPGALGNVGSSLVQERFGNEIKNAIGQRQGK